jgi:hypothetical protein
VHEAAKDKAKQANVVPKKRSRSVFVVPFFLDGKIDRLRVYSDVRKAQTALRRYVGYSDLLKRVKADNPGMNARRSMLDAYGAISKTPFAGTEVYEIEVDAPSRSRLAYSRSSARDES